MIDDKIIDFLYGQKKILNSSLTKEQVEFDKERACKINELLERKVFNQQDINEIENTSPYKYVEKAYKCILSEIIKRSSQCTALKERTFHIIVTGGIDLRIESTEQEGFILLEWPLIKYIDLLNTSILCANDFKELHMDCLAILQAYTDKFIQEKPIEIFSNLYNLDEINKEKYQIMQLFQQIQSIYILGHEIGHLLHKNATDLEAEILADTEALNIVFEYTRHNTKIKPWAIISIMLLFSYLELLNVNMASSTEKKILVRDNWLQRYDSVLDQIQSENLHSNTDDFISMYDQICNFLDELTILLIESS